MSISPTAPLDLKWVSQKRVHRFTENGFTTESGNKQPCQARFRTPGDQGKLCSGGGCHWCTRGHIHLCTHEGLLSVHKGCMFINATRSVFVVSMGDPLWCRSIYVTPTGVIRSTWMCSKLIPHVRGLEVSTQSQQEVKSWTGWKINNFLKKEEDTGQTTAPKLERQVKTGSHGLSEQRLTSGNHCWDQHQGKKPWSVTEELLEAQCR